ncbi:MAG: 16S rRNA (cytidine(1402)-2'-O)-methyltransferase [Clostridia bacterium]|nr:16S rRNA (cytidine(1402)-2'-O)-methyltransferase [Clostridia bacterium]
MIYFAATPIGNLKDITLRVLETLKEADAIFCEDTRHTLKLLSAYDIKKPLYACHKFNESEAAEKIVALSKEGKNVVIVSDAGMPVISDPGAVVAKKLQEAGEKFTVLPGACAFVSALALAAFPSEKFTFLGFLPDKTGERRRVLEQYKEARETLIFHAAPQDVDAYIKVMYEVFGSRSACAVREITKIHEEVLYFDLKDGLKGEKRGEFVLLVEGAAEKENPLNALSVREHLQKYLSEGMDKKEAIKLVSRERGVPRNEVYQEAIDL